jgi:hypothetical protein
MKKVKENKDDQEVFYFHRKALYEANAKQGCVL